MANLLPDTDGTGTPQTRVIGGNGTQSLSFTLPPGVDIAVASVVADIDASGAGADVQPELRVLSDNGAVIAAKPQGDTIPAGSSALATWALRLGDNGGGLKFGKVNTGNWLDVRTTASGPTGQGIWLQASDDVSIFALGGDVTIAGSNGFFSLSSGGGDAEFVTAGGTINIDSGGGDITISAEFGGEVSINSDVAAINSNSLGFFGVIPVTQQATPATLGDVIALLQTYGLAA